MLNDKKTIIMKTLNEIQEFGTKYVACSSQLNKFNDFIELKDDLQAWQTVLGNKKWFKDKELDLDWQKVEKLAQNIGKTWHEDGQRFEETTYENGKLNGTYKTWYENGQLISETAYENSQRHGTYKHWYSDGQLWIETTYENGQRHGSYKDWHANGQLRVETTYENDKLNGTYKHWYSNGQLMEEAIYKNGELI